MTYRLGEVRGNFGTLSGYSLSYLSHDAHCLCECLDLVIIVSVYIFSTFIFNFLCMSDQA